MFGTPIGCSARRSRKIARRGAGGPSCYHPAGISPLRFFLRRSLEATAIPADPKITPATLRLPTIHLLNGLHEGGAAAAARTLEAGLRDRGVKTAFYAAARLGYSDDGVIVPARWRRTWSDRVAGTIRFRVRRERFKRVIRGRRGSEIFSDPRGDVATRWPPKNAAEGGRGILHLHWISKFLDWPSFFASLPNDQPVVWTLHDMNPASGGCHFAEGCHRFEIGCGRCPQLPAPAADDDLSREFFDLKRKALEPINLHVVAPSRWLLDRARSSPILAGARSFSHIPYGLPLDECAATDRSVARASLDLPEDAFVFAFGAADLTNRRKGGELLLEALRVVAEPSQTGGRPVIGLLFGGGDLPQVSTPHPPLRTVGFVRGRRAMARIHSACDALVLPSTEDNLPITGLEALAAGTPVVAFDAGGVPDYVRDGETGLLAPVGDTVALGAALQRLVVDPKLAVQLGENAARVATAEFNQAREANAYIELYRRLSDS